MLLIALVPLAVALMASLTPDARLFDIQARQAEQLTTDHYRALFAERAFWIPIRNSLIVAIATTDWRSCSAHPVPMRWLAGGSAAGARCSR